jgi:hypothetical protein
LREPLIERIRKTHDTQASFAYGVDTKVSQRSKATTRLQSRRVVEAASEKEKPGPPCNQVGLCRHQPLLKPRLWYRRQSFQAGRLKLLHVFLLLGKQDPSPPHDTRATNRLPSSCQRSSDTITRDLEAKSSTLCGSLSTFARSISRNQIAIGTCTHIKNSLRTTTSRIKLNVHHHRNH